MNNLDRYSRQILFSEIGEEGQKKLLESTVVILGCGALGTVQANALVRAGVGRLRLIDRDRVEESNLQRQVIFDEADAKENVLKAEAAKQKLELVNSNIKIESVVSNVNHDNIEALIQDADIVLDAVDNFETRFLLNEACFKLKLPWVFGACAGSYGLVMPIIPDSTPCFNCVFEEASFLKQVPNANTDGILSPLVNVVASLQVTEALKYLVGDKENMLKGLMTVDVWKNVYRNLELSKKGDCAVCSI